MRLPVALLVLALSPLVAQDPVDSIGWLNRGVQAFKNAQYPDAIAAFQEAVDMDPTSVPTRLYLATAYMRQFIPGSESPENLRFAELANDEFVRVLDVDDKNTVAMTSLGSLYLNQKKWDEAQRWFETLVAVDPNNADAYYTLGFIAWSKWYPAYGAARARLGMKQEDPGPIPDIAVRQDLKSQYGPVIDAGLQALQKALQIKPQFSDAMAYMNLLIRERADLRDTPAEYQRDTAAADEWVRKALAAKKPQAEPQMPQTQSAPGAPQRIRIGGSVQESKLVNHVAPVYPPAAAQIRLAGVVHLDVIIGNTGRVSNVTVIGGHPLLVPAALEAVKQWVYQPTLLNGIPVEVVTQVDVYFPLPQ
jgi:TonB family protein